MRPLPRAPVGVNVRPHRIMRPAQLSLAFFGLCLLAACAAPLGVSTEDLSRMQECKAGFGSSTQTVGENAAVSGSRSAAREHPGKAPHGTRTAAPDRVSEERGFDSRPHSPIINRSRVKYGVVSVHFKEI